MNRRRFLSVVLILVVVVIVGIAGYYFVFSKQLFCRGFYDEIENDLDAANYCATDSDCDVLPLGGEYVEFNCYHFVNNKVDKNAFYKKMDIYNERCTDIIDKCARAPKPSCVSNKCTYVE